VTTVFLGGGRITSALLAGLRLAKDRRRIIVHDRHPEKLRQLKKLYGVVVEPDLRRAVDAADLLMIAVRPSSVAALLQEIGAVDRPLIAVSLAAGVPLANLRRWLGSPVRWARAMPSPACRTRNGLTALTFDRRFPARKRREIKQLFAKVGMFLEIPERKFDAFTVTFSCSHGYHALATLAGAAEKLGLDKKTALLAASHALGDAITAWRAGDTALKELLHEAATPGGTAAATMEGMDKAGYRRAVRNGMSAGLKRASKNAAYGLRPRV
jgi:pyrroline-5-carboxylate reductase